MDDNRPSAREGSEGTSSSDSLWLIEVRPRCAHCERLAATFDEEETPLCARHATIFLTAEHLDGLE